MEAASASAASEKPRGVNLKSVPSGNRGEKRQRKGARPPPPAAKEGDENLMSKKRLKIQMIMQGLPELSEWDPTELPHGFFVLLEGKRRTGKSTFAKWLLQWYQKRFSLVWVMTNTPMSGYWQQFVGSDYVFDGYHPEALQVLFRRNDKIIKEHGEDSPITLATASTLIIFDDCIDQAVYRDDMLSRLATEGRHHCCSVIFMTQDPKAISPKIRDNCDVAVIFNQKTFRNKEAMWHDFMNDVDKDTALALLAKHCIFHNALVCEQTNLDGEITRNFFISTGDKTKLQDPNYILGGPEQAEIVRKERAKKREEARMRKIKDAADRRPLREKVDQSLTAGKFTVKKTAFPGTS